MNAEFRAGWQQVLVCVLLLASGAMITTGYGVLAVPLTEAFHPSRMVLMLALTILMLATGVLSPFVGSLMDRWSLRLLMSGGIGLTVLGFFALSFVQSFNQVLAIYALLMAPAIMLAGPMPVIVLLSRWFDKRRGTAIGIALTGLSIGGVGYPPVAQFLLDNFSWPEAMRLLAVVILILALPVILLVKERPSEPVHNAAAAANAASAPVDAVALPPFSVMKLLRDPTFWIIGTICGAASASMMGMIANIVPQALEQGIDAGSAALLVSVYAVGGFTAKLVFAAVADRVPPRYLLLLSIGGYATGMACLIVADTGYWTMIAGVAVIGLFGGLIAPLQNFLVPRIFGAHVVGRVIGILNVVVLCLILVTPPIFGLVHDITGSYKGMYLAITVISLALMLLVPYVRMQPKDVPAPAPAPLAAAA